MLKKLLLALLGLGIAGLICAGILVAYIVILANPKLPSLEVITDYRPKVPLRIYTADNELIGEFGEERRNVTPIKDFPESLKNAVISIEDDRFYEHPGVDIQGIARAALVNLSGKYSQGASTITMQVARNFFLTNEKTLNRKVYEILLSLKIEKKLKQRSNS